MKWEKPEKIHLTLRFLGDQPRDTVNEIDNSLAGYVSGNSVKTAILSSGAFPDMKRPKVLYLGLEANDDLISLKEKVDKCLGEIGFPAEERDFVPHLTIGRVKKRPELPDVLPEIKRIRFGLESVTLFKSELRKSGSLHIPLKYFKL